MTVTRFLTKLGAEIREGKWVVPPWDMEGMRVRFGEPTVVEQFHSGEVTSMGYTCGEMQVVLMGFRLVGGFFTESAIFVVRPPRKGEWAGPALGPLS